MFVIFIILFKVICDIANKNDILNCICCSLLLFQKIMYAVEINFSVKANISSYKWTIFTIVEMDTVHILSSVLKIKELS